MQLNPLANLSVPQLNQAIAIREEIEKLETELGRMLSGPGLKYDDVCCAQFGLGRGARREHPPAVGL